MGVMPLDAIGYEEYVQLVKTADLSEQQNEVLSRISSELRKVFGFGADVIFDKGTEHDPQSVRFFRRCDGLV